MPLPLASIMFRVWMQFHAEQETSWDKVLLPHFLSKDCQDHSGNATRLVNPTVLQNCSKETWSLFGDLQI